MNKIYKVMYSKVKQCCVVVSEIAKSHGRHTKRSVAKSSAALTAGVLIALGSFSFEGMPVVQAADGTESLRNNDFVGANDYYWYYDEKEKDKDKKWKTYQYKATDIFNNRSRHDLPNYQGGGAKLPGAITAGLYAQAGQQTVTIGDRNAGQSKGSVFIGEHSGYNNGDNAPAGMKNNYVTSVGFQSDATGWGSIAIGSNATAENSKMESQVVEEVGDAHTSGTVSDDTYGIKEKPTIQGASVALGYSAKAKDGNIAIGAYSDAMDTSSATPYVSVGNGTLKRRITNVANGTDNSDVVTVGQMNDAIKQADNLNVNAGWGINVADENDPTNTGKGTKNVISLKHNLGTGYNDDEAKGMIIGGLVEDRDPAKQYGAADANSVIVGAGKALASGKSSVVVGGLDNVASGATSVVIGGDNNNAAGNQSAVFGGRDNRAAGVASTASGGIMNAAVGQQATAIGGSNNYVLGKNATAVGGLGRDYANGEVVYDSAVRGSASVGIAGGSTGEKAMGALAAGHQAVVTTENGTAIGYQATTDEAKTIAFGHDAGDVSGYTIEWNQLPKGQVNADGTANDYTKAPKSVTPTTYKDAYYNRLVKVADGIDDHDVVVMEQLKNAKNDLKVNAGWGINVNDVTTKNADDTETTTKNVISLNRNLGTNYGNTYDGEIYGGKGKVTFEADGENSLILGGGAINNSFEGKDNDFSYGAHAKDSVLVGGMNNSIEKQSEGAIIVGGTYNTASSANQVQYTGKNTIIVGGMRNKAEGNGALLIGGSDNQALSTGEVQQTGEDTIIIGGSSNKAEGDGSVLIGGSNNESLGLNTTTIGGWHNKNEGWISSIWGGTYNQITGIAQAAGIFGGNENKISNAGSFASILGGEKNTVEDAFGVVVGGSANKSSNMYSSVFGGTNNIASGAGSSVIGGEYNAATNAGDVISGGFGNLTSGNYAYAAGGTQNYVTGMEASSLGGIYSSVNGRFSTGVAGGSTGQEAFLSLAGGYQSVVADGGAEKTYLTGADAIKVLEDMYSGKKLPGYYMRDPSVETGPDNPGRLIHYDKFSTALGYQATANKPGTIAFGHDAGDESGYTYEWEQLPDGQVNLIDGTTNDYTKAPKSVKKKEPYTSAYYNRLVKVADGIDDHDVVVMEQLKQYAEKDASNLGNNIKVYKTDENGNVQLDGNKQPVEDTDATTTAQKNSKDAWGKALGAEPFTTGTPAAATDASTSDQLVTGKTLYNYDAPVAETGKNLNYVSANNTTGQNLSALDAQVADNASKLNDKTHNIKYYSVNDKKSSTQETLPIVKGLLADNSDNKGAKGMGSLASGFSTEADGIASTVAGSYSGVIGSGLQGAAAVSVGTVNVNNNTDPNKKFSGVANSIVGQANMTTDSNAAIIVGAGNTVTNSYRRIDPKKAGAILDNVFDPTNLSKAMQDAVKDSGGQVMVMGGGNNVESAYMSQVVGVGNTVKGNQVKNDKGEWVTDTSNDTSTDTSNTAIQDYDPEKSSQYNYVDGFNNEVINGKHDYVIGANNKLSGDSYDDDQANPIKRSNKSNIVIGDNHTLTRKQNTVIIGSSDTENTQTIARDAVIIGHNANATSATGADNAVAIGRAATATGGNAVTIGVNTKAGDNSITIGSESSAISGENIAIGRYAKVDGYKVTKAVALGQMANALVADGVAIGSNSIATVAGNSVEGYDPTTGQTSTNTTATWQATKAAVSIGTADGKVTRQINGVAAGTNDTDAVNVAQIKKLASINASNIGANLQYGADGTTAVTDTDKTKNKEAWATAIGTGTVTKDDDGSKQMVTGKTVYDALHGGLDNITVGKDGQNGKDGSIGIAGQNGKDGYTMTIIKTEQGAAGVDGKDGITRVVYQDKDGNGKHTFATLDDGLKFKGDDSTVIAKKLNEQLSITGGADSTNLTDKNIGVNSSTDGLKIQLAKDLTSITSISGSTDTNGAKITLDTTDMNISVNGGSIKDVATNLDRDGKIISGNENNAANMSDVQTLVQQGVDNGYTHGDGITIQKDGTSGKNVISVNQGDGLKFDSGKLAVNTGDGLTVDETTKALKIKTSDSNLKVDRNGIGLNNVITIGTAGTNAHPITIDGTKGEVSGLNNTSWDSTANYSNSTKAATESQVAAAVKDAIKQAGDNDVDTHVKAGSYGVDANHQVSMDIVDKNGKATGKKVTITDVATHTEVGDVTTLDKGVQNASGTTSVVDAINNVNTSMNTKIGDQKYSKSNTSGTNKYVSDGDSITSAIGKLDGAVQQAASAAGKHSTVSEGSNIKVNGNVQNDGHMDYKVSLKDDISLNSVTTDTLTVNNSATIGGVTIANKTISGLDDTKIENGSTNAVNAGTIWNELRPSGGTYINQNNTTAQNITNLDTQVKKNSDLVNSDGSTIKIGSKDSATKVDISDKNGSGRVVTGVVTDTNDASSAANVGYVNGVTAANTQQIYRDMNNAYGRLNNNINKAAAGSNALAALHPLDYDPDDKADFAVGYGHYRNANAAAVGAFYHPNENTMVNVGVSLGNGDPGFNAGVSFKVGRGGAGREAMSKTEMAKVINSQSKEIDALKKDNADKDKRIDALEQKMAEILAKLDKNGK